MRYSLTQVAAMLHVKRSNLLKLEESMQQLIYCTMHTQGERYDEEALTLLRAKLMEIYAQGMTLGQYLQSIGKPVLAEATAPIADVQQQRPETDTDHRAERKAETDEEPAPVLEKTTATEKPSPEQPLDSEYNEEAPAAEWYADKLYAESQGQMVFGFGSGVAASSGAVNALPTRQVGEENKVSGQPGAIPVMEKAALEPVVTNAVSTAASATVNTIQAPADVPSGVYKRLVLLEQIAHEPHNLVPELANLSAILSRSR